MIERDVPRHVSKATSEGRIFERMSMRRTLDRYWKLSEAAPHGIALQVRVTNGSGDFSGLPFPCRLTAAGWVNAITGTALVVNPTYWKLYVETLPSRRAWTRRSTRSSIRKATAGEVIPHQDAPYGIRGVRRK